MAHAYYYKPVTYNSRSLISKYSMPGVTTKSNYSHVSSSGYGRNTPTRSYSVDRAGSASSNHRVSSYVSNYEKNITSRPPSGRALPKGPGPQDSSGRKMEISEALKHNKTRTSRTTGPMKGSYVPSTISKASSTGTGKYSNTHSPSYGGTGSISRDLRNTHISDASTSSMSSLERSRKYGSTNSINSYSDRHQSHENIYPISNKASHNQRLTHTININIRDNSKPVLPEIHTFGTPSHKYHGSSPTSSKLYNNNNEAINDSAYNHSSYRDENRNYVNKFNRSDRSSVCGSESGTGKNGYDSSSSETSPVRVRRQSENGSLANINMDDNQGLKGLRNLGNTCFMNTMIQCLSNTRPVLEYFVSGKYKDDINTVTSVSKMRALVPQGIMEYVKRENGKGELAHAFAELLTELWDSSRRSSSSSSSSYSRSLCADPTAFKSKVNRLSKRFNNYNQQDAQEFLIYLLEGLHADVNKVKEKKKRVTLDEKWDKESAVVKGKASWEWYRSYEDSVFLDIFVGQLRSVLTCDNCSHESNTFDCFWDIAISLGDKYGLRSLNDCMDDFFKEERLSSGNKVKCDKCKKYEMGTKSLSIWKYPEILIIQLKKFSYTSRGFMSKVNSNISFPVEGLDLTEYITSDIDRKRPPIYNLIGVGNHAGSMSSGHYWATARHPYSGRWHKFDDSIVSPMNAKSAVTSAAYVLFYELAES